MYLLESLKTAALCDWSNVSLIRINPAWEAQFPRIFYNDEQFAFVEKMERVWKGLDIYWCRPFILSMKGVDVVIGLRERFMPDNVHTCPVTVTRCTERALRAFLLKQQALFDKAKPKVNTPCSSD